MSTQDCVLGYSQPSLRDCFVAERNRNRTRAPGLPQRSPEFLAEPAGFPYRKPHRETCLVPRAGNPGRPDLRILLGLYCFQLGIESVTAQQVRQVLRKGGAWHHHVTACFHSFRLQVALQMREKTDH
jgi:hypothetical protein